MRILILSMLLIGFAGCGTLNEMNSNMVKTNELMDENIVVTTQADQTIQQNTASVNRSTDSMIEFEDIIADNSKAVNRVMDEIDTNAYALSLGVIIFLILLFLPSIILVIFYFKFLRRMKDLLRK